MSTSNIRLGVTVNVSKIVSKIYSVLEMLYSKESGRLSLLPLRLERVQKQLMSMGHGRMELGGSGERLG